MSTTTQPRTIYQFTPASRWMDRPWIGYQRGNLFTITDDFVWGQLSHLYKVARAAGLSPSMARAIIWQTMFPVWLHPTTITFTGVSDMT